jgi:hypothetical protein
MAHEFGHFSQRSMKLGSFVYQLNRIIYNMLFENKGYGNMLSSFGRASDTFSLFASITVGIVKGIQYVLQRMYGLINKSYMALSREMEFHADTVAASVAGGNNLANALRRIELGNSAYELVLAEYNKWTADNKKGSNLYKDHTLMLHDIANDLKTDIAVDGLPVMADHIFEGVNKSRVVFKDQWASHPEREMREAHLKSLNLDVVPSNESAWVLFEQVENIQQELTELVYRNVEWETTPGTASNKDFKEQVAANNERYRLPEIYAGFYNGRSIERFDINQLMQDAEAGIDLQQPEEILTPENASIQKHIQINQRDIETLEAIANKNIDVKSFDFDGNKYTRAEANDIIEQLKKENEDLSNQLKKLDQQLFKAIWVKAGQDKTQLQHGYDQLFTDAGLLEVYDNRITNAFERFAPLLQGQTMSADEAASMVNAFKTQEEPSIKEGLQQMLTQGFLAKASIQEKATTYLSRRYQYFTGDSFFDTEINDLFSTMQQARAEAAETQFCRFKKLLEMQAGVINDKALAAG